MTTFTPFRLSERDAMTRWARAGCSEPSPDRRRAHRPRPGVPRRSISRARAPAPARALPGSRTVGAQRASNIW